MSEILGSVTLLGLLDLLVRDGLLLILTFILAELFKLVFFVHHVLILIYIVANL